MSMISRCVTLIGTINKYEMIKMITIRLFDKHKMYQ